MDTAIEWIIDFFEFFQIPIVLGVGYLLFKKFVSRSSYAEPGQRSLPAKILGIFFDGPRNYANGTEHDTYHTGNNDPDFSYINHDVDEPEENRFMEDPYGNPQDFDPNDAEHVAYVESYDNNKY